MHPLMGTLADTRLTCEVHVIIVICMPKTLQVRDVPEDVHRTLKARAALAGLSLSEFVLQELERVAKRPSREELYERLRRRRPVELEVSVAELIAAERLAR